MYIVMRQNGVEGFVVVGEFIDKADAIRAAKQKASNGVKTFVLKFVTVFSADLGGVMTVERKHG